MSQGAVKVSGASGILQSSGEYPLGSLKAGEWNLEVEAESGPPAIWTATVRALPVVINNLSFGQTCIAPGTGVPATFSVTGDTTVSATVRNASGHAVRDLGTFGVKMGKGSIPWDGRNGAGGGVPSGSYALDLVSSDPQGHSTGAQAAIHVSSSGPAVSMTSPSALAPGQAVAFKIAETPCEVASVKVVIDGQHVSTYGEYGERGYGEAERALPANGVLIFSAHDGWSLGAHQWRIEAADKAGNRRVATGRFAVRRGGNRCLVPRVTGRKLRAAKRQIHANGCRVGSVKLKRQRGWARPGRVISVRPRPGVRNPLRSQVHLVVARW